VTDDPRTYIKVHDGMPDHPKIVGLTDAAFRLLVECWCYCSRHLTDGKLTDAALRKIGGPKPQNELVKAGMLELLPDGLWQAHDYLQHQRSAAEVSELRSKRRAAGKASAAARAQQNGSKRSASVEQVAQQNGNKTATETETETEEVGKPTSGRRKRTTPPPDHFDLTDDLRKWAVDHAPDVKLVVETARMLDWARGKGETKVDWDATWRNWMSRAQDNFRAAAPVPAARSDVDRKYG
jgi:hypothetical protein